MAMIYETPHLGKYHLCPNAAVKFTFLLGIFLQIATLALAIAMLSTGGLVTITQGSKPEDPENRFALNRNEGLFVDCYLNTVPRGFAPETKNKCYMKDFGQYTMSHKNVYLRSITIVGATLVSIALLTCAADIGMGIHLFVIWVWAPYDSFFVRAYRLFVGFGSAISSCLFLVTMVVFHVGLRLSVQLAPWETLEVTEITFDVGYFTAWACVGASILAAWVTVSSTCCWALDYVNCRSLAAAYNPTCSHRASTLSMNNGIANSVYGLNMDGGWSIQEKPTLPRYHTSTYGDGSEIRNKQPETQVKEIGKDLEVDLKK